MISRNDVRVDTVRVDSQQLRDIQELISKLDDVNRQLAQPVHAVPFSRLIEAPTEAPALGSQTADAASA